MNTMKICLLALIKTFCGKRILRIRLQNELFTDDIAVLFGDFIMSTGKHDAKVSAVIVSRDFFHIKQYFGGICFWEKHELCAVPAHNKLHERRIK